MLPAPTGRTYREIALRAGFEDAPRTRGQDEEKIMIDELQVRCSPHPWAGRHERVYEAHEYKMLPAPVGRTYNHFQRMTKT